MTRTRESLKDNHSEKADANTGLGRLCIRISPCRCREQSTGETLTWRGWGNRSHPQNSFLHRPRV